MNFGKWSEKLYEPEEIKQSLFRNAGYGGRCL
jgi:hypothetical protein